MNPSTLHFAVFGSPILHSQSPALFKTAFQRAGLPHTYTRVLCTDAQQVEPLFQELHLQGANLTAPLKETYAHAATALDSPEVRALKAVNTLYRKDGRLHCANTDPEGVRLALQTAGPIHESATALVLGAGGSAKAALWALRNLGVSRRLVINRHDERAISVADALDAEVVPYASRLTALATSDILISCLPAFAVNDALPVSVLMPRHRVLEADYKQAALAAPCAHAGANYIPGLSWLRHQAQAAAGHFGLAVSIPDLEEQGRSKHHSESWQRIALCGFMGAGKSSVGLALARRLNWDFLDLDAAIEAKTGRRVPDIFATDGEEAFRALETQTLDDVTSHSRMVLALGGGAADRAENQALLRRFDVTVWLHANLDACAARVGKTDRPLWQHGPEFLENLYAERLSVYHRVADLVVPTFSDSIETLAERIFHELDSSLQR